MNQAQQFPEGTFLGRAALSSLVEAYRGLYREPSDSLHFTPKPDLYRACFLAEGTGDHLADLKHILKYKAYLETGEDDESIPFPLEAYLSGPTWEDKMRHADNKGEALHKSVLGEARQSACSDCCCPLRRSAGQPAHDDVRRAPRAAARDCQR